MHPEPFQRGTHDFMRATTALLLDGARDAVRQRLRVQPDAAGARRGDPAALRSAPRRCWRGKLWREQLREWDETPSRPAIAKHREIQAVDPDALSDDELVAYLTRCREHHSAMIYQHMRFTAAAMHPDR